MISNPDNIELNSTNLNQFSIKKFLSIYAKKWYWFALCIFVCFIVAFINLRYTTPEYLASAKIMLIDEMDVQSPNSGLSDLSMYSNIKESKVEDEILVMKSKKFLLNIVKKLDLNIAIYTKGKIYETELYKNLPIDINFVASDSIVDQIYFNFHLNINSNFDFYYKIREEDEPTKIAFGKSINTYFGEMVITPKNNIDNYINTQMRVEIYPLNSVAQSLKNRIYITPYGESSKVVDLSLKDPISEKAKDIINTLIEEYNKSSLELKNKRADETAKFINERVELIASDLVNVDDSIVRFKTGNKVTNVTSEAGQFLASSSQNEQQLDAARTQLRLLNYMDSSLGEDDSSFQPIPSNLGMGDIALSSLSNKYNELLSNRERLLKSAGSKNAVIVELDNTLNGIKKNLRQSINNSTKSLNISISSLENQSNKINSKIYSVPGQESRLRSIERKQGIKESLYLYLLQKREEAAISVTTSSTAGAKVIDEAYSSGSPVSPNKKIIYLGALVIGFLIPFGTIYIKDLLDTKIHNKEDLQQEIKNITVLGEIPRLKGKEADLLIQKNDRSILSESFRIVRTNFDYVLRGRDVKNYNNVVFITSTINGEGKSFFAMNIALTLANSDKRVLLIGADIRNPKNHPLLKEQINKRDSKIGLTEYLVDKAILVGEAINTYDINGNKIDVMLSGKIPPNPAELLMTDKMKLLFDKVSEQYDYVIVDTAPSMLVTDTLLFSQYAGHTIYMTRAGYTEKNILNFAKELHTNNKLNGMMLVVNDVDQSNFGYGARYGYYGAPEKKSWFKRRKA